MPGRGSGACEALCELRRKGLDAAGTQKEGLHRLGLSLEHLLGKVGEHVHAQPRVGEGVFQGCGVQPFEGHPGQHYARRPAFGEREQPPHELLLVPSTGPQGQHLGDLGRIEEEEVSRDACDLAAESQLLQPERRLVSREDDEVDRLGAVLEQVAEYFVHAGGVHGLVVVVEDDVSRAS